MNRRPPRAAKPFQGKHRKARVQRFNAKHPESIKGGKRPKK